MFKTKVRIALTGLATAALLVTASTGVASARYTADEYGNDSEMQYQEPDRTIEREMVEVHSTGDGATEEECNDMGEMINTLIDLQDRFYADEAFGDAVSVGVAINQNIDAAEDAGCFVIH